MSIVTMAGAWLGHLEPIFAAAEVNANTME